jgi:glycosyltransferase involved in cell wall biosynthesis
VIRAINSALNTIPNGEVVVVDDASTDDTVAILNKNFVLQIATKKLVVIKNKINLGVTGAKNAGYKVAKSNWVIFLDSDDYYTSKGGNLILSELTAYPKTPIVFFRCVDEQGKPIGQQFYKNLNLDLTTYIRHTSFGEALTAINKDLVKYQPYITQLKGYEGLGCCRIIKNFGPAVLSQITARVYTKNGRDRLSTLSGFLQRMPLLAKGHLILVKEFGIYMKLNTMITYILKAYTYYTIGSCYKLYKKASR